MSDNDDDVPDGAAALENYSMKEMVEALFNNVKQNADLMKQNQELIAALASNRGASPSAEAIRAEKLAKSNLALRKSTKLKDFRDTQDGSIKKWLKKLDQEFLRK